MYTGYLEQYVFIYRRHSGMCSRITCTTMHAWFIFLLACIYCICVPCIFLAYYICEFVCLYAVDGERDASSSQSKAPVEEGNQIMPWSSEE